MQTNSVGLTVSSDWNFKNKLLFMSGMEQERYPDSEQECRFDRG